MNKKAAIKKIFKKLFGKKRKVLLLTGAIFVVLIFVLSFAGYTLAFSKKVYPRVFAGGEKLSGLKQDEIKAKLDQKASGVTFDKVILVYQDKSWEIPLSEIGFQYDVDKTVNKVWKIGRQPSLLQTLKEQILVLFKPMRLDMEESFDEQKVQEKIKAIASEIDVPERVISFTLENDEIKMLPPKEGQKVFEEETTSAFKHILGNFKNTANVAVIKITPKIKEDQTEAVKDAKAKFEKMVAFDLTIGYDDQKFEVKPEKIQKWAKFVEKPLSFNSYVLDVELNEDVVGDYIKSIAGQIDQEPIDAKLTVADGRAIVFQAHQNGFKLDQEDALAKINQALFLDENSDRQIKLTVLTLKPAVRTETINELGIKELIGEGTSSFSGSPSNRIHNITVGANMFNGVLIKPGGTFSFNQILGEVSASKGFLPELVIKEDRLIPETGGGLCQVSTTMFRAAIYSGLDILERTPHSFRVRYYEPPVGLDATVYYPKPDLKFKNDTPGYILIQTKIVGSKLTFQFYGTKDGRSVEIKGPYTSGYTSPGPAVYIDDPSMPAGEVKQIEKAVPGLTAIVYWTVYRNGQVLHQQTFVSKYVAWQAKYKRGPAAPAPPPPPAEQPPAEQPPPSG